VEQTCEELIAAVARDGLRKHARWDADLFAELSGGAARAVWQTIQGGAQAKPVFSAYLQLVEEALGAGYLRRDQAGPSPRPANFLSLCLVRLIPRSLAGIPEGGQLPWLAKVWNLGEGLLREPAWVDRFVTACASSVEEVTDIEGFLVRTLEPVLTPARPARWEGPFTVTVLDTRPLDDEFLPGDMHLAAPAVLCVHDRRRPESHLGVFLQQERRSRFLGVSPCLGQYPAPEILPTVKLAKQQMQVGSHTIELPFLHRGRNYAAAGHGFVVVSAADSQRLWVVESR